MVLSPHPLPPPPPFAPWFQTSPLMTREKKGFVSRRIIADLSWPENRSVSSGTPCDTYLGSPYKLHLPTPDDLVTLIRKQGQGCFLYSVDLARAYRQLRVDPLDWLLLGIIHNGSYYQGIYNIYSLLLHRYSSTFRHPHGSYVLSTHYKRHCAHSSQT